MTLQDDEIAKLLDLARRADTPDPARIARVRARLLAPGPDGDASQPQPSATWRRAWRAASLKVALSLSGISVAAVLAVYAVELRPVQPAAIAAEAPLQAPAVKPVPEAAPAPVVGPATPEQVDAIPSAVSPSRIPPVPRADKPRAPAVRRKAAKVSQEAASGDARAPLRDPVEPASASASSAEQTDEAGLLRLATLALRAGQLDQAHQLLERFRQRFPDSVFRLEYERLLARWRAASSAAP